MVLGFAMCATVAFAQTATRVTNSNELLSVKDVNAALKKAEAKPAPAVDYKASIFTKTGEYDTLRTFRFTAAEAAETGFSIGFLASGDHIYVNGQDSTISSAANAVSVSSNPWATWKRYADSATFVTNFPNDYQAPLVSTRWVTNRLGAINATDPAWADDGFMFYCFGIRENVGVVNAYFSLPAVSHTADAMISISVTQAYAKYYEQCFIDYQDAAGHWNVVEVNVTGVDVELGGNAPYKIRFVMPNALATMNQIKVRFRMYSRHRGNIYGYAWALDNVAIVKSNTNKSWSFNTPSTIDGFYATMPEGMTIPVAYGIHTRNTNLTDIANAKVTLKNAAEGGQWSNVASGTPKVIPQGDVFQNYNLVINERGFMQEDVPMDYGSQSWLGYYDNYGTNGLPQGYLGRGLNTNTTGVNYFTTIAEGTGIETRAFDTILYMVSDEQEFNPQTQPNRVNGHRWGRDNGVVPGGSLFGLAFTDEHYYSQDDPDDHTGEAGYYVMLRYVTGATVPENLVFRGLELVPRTDIEGADMVSTTGMIEPLIYEEVYHWEVENGDSVNYRRLSSVACGIDNMLYAVDESAVANLPRTGYKLPGQNYGALNIQFYDQPRLKPNTAYRFGYYLSAPSHFAVAATSDYYRTHIATSSSESDTFDTYNNNEELAIYANQIKPYQPYDLMVYDPIEADQLLGWYSTDWPMIRPIVGEPLDLPTVALAGNCSTNQGNLGVEMYRGEDVLCGQSYDVAVGSSQTVYINPIAEGKAIIDKVFINGEEIPVYDEDEDYPDSYYLLQVNTREDFNRYDAAGNVIMQRDGYILNLYQLPGDVSSYIITVQFHEGVDGIEDAIAANVGLKLAPNPATSTVKLNISGVTGMVNCNIIDMSGRVVYNTNINAEAETMLNVSNMPAGAYFVRITNDSFSKVEKLIIK